MPNNTYQDIMSSEIYEVVVRQTTVHIELCEFMHKYVNVNMSTMKNQSSERPVRSESL